ncbi:transposase [Thiocapsa sp.]|uniref:transposase n=1 Tax=Thiocapsa sp. TaxID=2024551 RepID=UPI003593527D
MLTDNLEAWTDQWKQEGLKQGREAVRHLLIRQVRRRFGPVIAEQSAPLLAKIVDLQQLEELDDQLLLSADGGA